MTNIFKHNIINNVLKNEDVLNAYIRGRGGMADALASGASVPWDVEVQLLSRAQQVLHAREPDCFTQLPARDHLTGSFRVLGGFSVHRNLHH